MKAIEDGEEKIRVPMRTEDLTLRFYMEIAWANLDGRLGTYTFSVQYVREIGRLHPIRMEAPAETFETARPSAWGNVRLFDELTNGGDRRFDELRNAPEVRRVLV